MMHSVGAGLVERCFKEQFICCFVFSFLCFLELETCDTVISDYEFLFFVLKNF